MVTESKQKIGAKPQVSGWVSGGVSGITGKTNGYKHRFRDKGLGFRGKPGLISDSSLS